MKCIGNCGSEVLRRESHWKYNIKMDLQVVIHLERSKNKSSLWSVSYFGEKDTN
jgi:hypothetical protein